MIQEKKSQAAMEFMVTYGWVILGVMIVIGALAYYGIFSTDKYINDECSFGTQLYCEDVEIYSGSSPVMNIRFRNNFGQTITITNMEIKYESKSIEYQTVFLGDIQSGQLVEYGGDLKGSPEELVFPSKEKVKLNVIVQFRRAIAGAPIHNVTGTIIATTK